MFRDLSLLSTVDARIQVADELVQRLAGTWSEVEEVRLVIGKEGVVLCGWCFGDSWEFEEGLDPTQGGETCLG